MPSRARNINFLRASFTHADEGKTSIFYASILLEQLELKNHEKCCLSVWFGNRFSSFTSVLWRTSWKSHLRVAKNLLVKIALNATWADFFSFLIWITIWEKNGFLTNSVTLSEPCRCHSFSLAFAVSNSIEATYVSIVFQQFNMLLLFTEASSDIYRYIYIVHCYDIITDTIFICRYIHVLCSRNKL